MLLWRGGASKGRKSSLAGIEACHLLALPQVDLSPRSRCGETLGHGCPRAYKARSVVDDRRTRGMAVKP